MDKYPDTTHQNIELNDRFNDRKYTYIQRAVSKFFTFILNGYHSIYDIISRICMEEGNLDSWFMIPGEYDILQVGGPNKI